MTGGGKPTLLYVSPVVPLLTGNGRAAHLDLDDIESTTHTRIAQLCYANGNDPAGRHEEWQSQQCRAAEQEAFRSFDRIYVCSENDRETLKHRVGVELCVLPNVVRLPEAPSAESGRNLLFVGTLGYYPN